MGFANGSADTTATVDDSRSSDGDLPQDCQSDLAVLLGELRTLRRWTEGRLGEISGSLNHIAEKQELILSEQKWLGSHYQSLRATMGSTPGSTTTFGAPWRHSTASSKGRSSVASSKGKRGSQRCATATILESIADQEKEGHSPARHHRLSHWSSEMLYDCEVAEQGADDEDGDDDDDDDDKHSKVCSDISRNGRHGSVHSQRMSQLPSFCKQGTIGGDGSVHSQRMSQLPSFCKQGTIGSKLDAGNCSRNLGTFTATLEPRVYKRAKRGKVMTKWKDHGHGMSVTKTNSSQRHGSGKSHSRLTMRSVMHPMSRTNLAMDLLSVVMLAYDMLILPVTLAWALPARGLVLFGSWTTVVFWSVDIVFCFFKGPGHETWLTTCRRYLQSWFLLDLLVLACDWVSLLLELTEALGTEGSELVRFVRILKLNRFVRVIAMVCTGRLNVFLERINKFCWAWSMLGNIRVFFKIMRFLLPGMLVNHWFACVFYAIGRYYPLEPTWLDTLNNHELWYVYMTALQWAVSLMFGGSPVVMAQNTAELGWTVLALVIGAICGSLLISLTATMMMDMQAATKFQRKQVFEVQHFVHEHGVNNVLAAAILQQVRERTAQTVKPLLRDVPILSRLSASLWRELAFQLFHTDLRKHSFLMCCHQVEPTFLQAVCGQIKQIVLATNDELFSCGELAEACYIVRTGSAIYIEEGDAEGEYPITVHPHQWLAELALWLNWRHKGTTVASKQSELLGIGVDDFMKSVKLYGNMSEVIESYCKVVSSYLELLPFDCISDLPLEAPPASVNQDLLLLLMPSDTRHMLSEPALQERAGTWQLFGKKHGQVNFEDELEQFCCIFQTPQPGKIVQVVAVAVLRLSTSDDKELLCMGKVSDGETKAVGYYPSVEMRNGELPMQAVERLVMEEMPSIADRIELERTSTHVQETYDQAKGFLVKHVQVIFFARLADEVKTEEVGRAMSVTKGVVSKARSSMRSRASATRLSQSLGAGFRGGFGRLRDRLGKRRGSGSLADNGPFHFDPDHRCQAFQFTEKSIYAWIFQGELCGDELTNSATMQWLSELEPSEAGDLTNSRPLQYSSEGVFAGSCGLGSGGLGSFRYHPASESSDFYGGGNVYDVDSHKESMTI